MNLKQSLAAQLKNSFGWKTRRKLVVFAVDDYGNVRMNSSEAAAIMNLAGMPSRIRFDDFDSLETTDDLISLFEVLDRYKDKQGRKPCITPFVNVQNLDFERMVNATSDREIHFELLPVTFEKLARLSPQNYSGTWQTWQDGIQSGFLSPQYHGPFHLNIFHLRDLIANNSNELKVAIECRSYSRFRDAHPGSNVYYSVTFAFDRPDQIPELAHFAKDGVGSFKTIFGFEPIHFMAPSCSVHDDVLGELLGSGIRAVDQGIFQKQHLGQGRYQRAFNYTGKKNRHGQLTIVRNVVFEPTHPGNTECLNRALTQIDAAFCRRRPAIISSHRVNFCGRISESNRELGLSSLDHLLKEIVKRWPDVEFISSAELIGLIENDS